MIRNLPFLWRTKATPNDPLPAGVPERMDFEWDWDHDLRLLRQKVTLGLRTALKAIYAAGSENLGATPAYGAAFAKRIVRFIKGQNRPCVLEIGPGTGWLTSRMIDAGAVVCSHNGPWPVDDTEKYPGLVDERFDLIVHHYVLEHVEDPVAFLKACREYLRPNGTMVFVVPDCTESVALGDISMANHQHINYFTHDSIMEVGAAAGLTVRPTFENGSIVAWAAPGKRMDCVGDPRHSDGRRALQTYGAFATRADVAASCIRYIINQVKAAAMVVPMRGLAYLPEWTGRMFDDGMAGKYLDGVTVPGHVDWSYHIHPFVVHRRHPDMAIRIEPLSAIDDSVPTAFVFSLTHEREIVEKIKPRCRRIVTLREMLNAV